MLLQLVIRDHIGLLIIKGFPVKINCFLVQAVFSPRNLPFLACKRTENPEKTQKAAAEFRQPHK